MKQPEAFRRGPPISIVRTLTSPLKLVDAGIGHDRPCIHVACTNPV
jgi:hypothetical protein